MNQRDTYVRVSIYILKRAFREAHRERTPIELETQWSRFWAKVSANSELIEGPGETAGEADPGLLEDKPGE